MLSPDLNTRSFRPYLASSISSPSFTSPSSSSSSPSSSTVFPSAPRISRGRNHQQAPPSNSASRSRFSASSFVHNGRVALALVPSAAFLLDLGGASVVATLTVGLMISYILDSLSFKSGSFFAVWASLIAAQVAFFFSSSLPSAFNSFPLGLLAAFLCAHANFLVGVWASLQFRWIQLENPSIVLALERLLFACIPFTASSLFAWATISAVGMANASYYLMIFNCVFYWLFAVPRISSFKSKQEVKYQGGEIPEDNFILGPLEGCVHTLNLLFSPLVFHVASHHSVAFSSAAAVSDLFLLFFIPFLFQLYASTRGALWWVTRNPHQLHSIRAVNGAVALVVVVICLEIRVVFHSFGRYIQVPPPWNYLLVTVTMLGGASGAGAYAVGMISDAVSSVVFTALAVTVSAAGAIVVGFPLLVWTF